MNNPLGYLFAIVLTFYAGLFAAHMGLTLKKALTPFAFLLKSAKGILTKNKSKSNDSDSRTDQTPRI